ncbi:thiamine pyrophosphate-dependent dehydrogenase E1 component subunit alpha [Vallitalea pronyensis]|uniref:Thiamine pyrophosphate-dependent dehydrogenase E1 component subunit alpha n=1 Tax=Vallitalea pronyensis TaxID=1348613 RepID=A0A8J8MPK3_9FIRM|nr:thiamine pyrophosphate-dependent dehydrogenase E1 component subunit alpha [Vallitalea pronyensis]QUI25284.1 thiamine pyrophosphate-dependent dehydrogenase E1 component subunit alpha [Vallitalea pronyensis]
MKKQELITAYKRMNRIRKFGEYVHESTTNKRSIETPFVGIMHIQTGEEGYSCALIPQLRDDDYLSTTYRNHAHTLARGMDLKGLAAEVCGRVTGVCKGRAGNMHAVDQNLNFIAGFGIIGAGLPSTCGTALASKIKETDQISVAFFGDGAMAQGAVHESLNIASVFKLPVLFVNNNNHYAMSTPSKNNLATESTINYAKGYAMKTYHCDGMDFFESYDVAKEAIDYVRSGFGPCFIEYDCYRYGGQFEGDPQDYKLQEEVDYYMAKDPLKRFREGAIERGLLTAEELDSIEKLVDQEVEEAMAFALNSEKVGPEDIVRDTYADVY